MVRHPSNRRLQHSDASSDVVGLIPARGGSKGISGKNLTLLGGKPLIVWTIESARASQVLDTTFVSTDDATIHEVATDAGASVPFRRPAHLARDDTPDFPVMLHFLDWYERETGQLPNVVVWLRPTSPLRRPDDIDQAVRLLQTTDASIVRSISKVADHPYWMKILNRTRLEPLIEGYHECTFPRRQDLPAVYALNGAVDVFRTKGLRARSCLFDAEMEGYLMPREISLDINTALDLKLVEALLQMQSG